MRNWATIMEYPDPIDRSWQASMEGLRPLWLNFEKLPPSVTDKIKNISKPQGVSFINVR